MSADVSTRPDIVARIAPRSRETSAQPPSWHHDAVTDPPGWTPPARPVPVGWSPNQPPPYPSEGPPPAAPGSWGAPGGWGPPQQWSPPPPPPKPGVIPLRPLGVGEILDGAISSIRSQPRIMLGLSAVVAVLTQLLIVPLTWLLLRDTGDVAFSLDEPASADEQFAFTASAVSAVGIQVVVTLLASLLLTGILTVTVSRAVLGQQIGAGQAWALARPRVPALLGVTGLVILIEVVVLALSVGPGVLLAVLGAPTPAVVVAFVLGVPLALGLAMYLYVAFALAPPAVVLERATVVASLRRSRQLVKGAWWRTFGILLLVNVIAQFLANILSVPFVVLTLAAAFLTGGGDGLNPYAILPLLVTALGTIVASAVTWPFTAVSTALIYVDRRIRLEALDIELARAAGIPVATAPGGAPPAAGTTPAG